MNAVPVSGEWLNGGFDTMPVQEVPAPPPLPKPAAPMSVVLGFVEREIPRVLQLLAHMATLSGRLDRTLYLLPCKGVHSEEITKAAQLAFSDVQLIDDNEGVTSDWRSDDNVRDAAGPNSLFRQAAWFFFLRRDLGPWLWLEPDCVPLSADWCERLEQAYRASGKPFLGTVMHWKQTGAAPNEYLNGVAIYPQNAIALAPDLVTRTMWEQFPEKEIAFDIAGGNSVHRQAHATDLIQLEYRGDGEPSARPGAVLFHGDRSGKLLQEISTKRNGGDAKCDAPVTNPPADNTSARFTGTSSNGAVKSEPETAPDSSAPTVGDQIRAHVQALATLASNSNRRTRVISELRKAKLVPRSR